MEKFNEDSIKKLLREQQSAEEGGQISEEDEQRYRAVFQFLVTWEEKEERSVADKVMQEIATLEVTRETQRNRWMFAGAMATVFIATGITCYFFLPLDLFRVLTYLKAHSPIILFTVGMLLIVQFADQKWVSKKLY